MAEGYRPQQPIIVIKKKGGHGGHHGGAWKVAYADFVTAMMAFFLVMWLMNTDQKIQEAVGAYFRDPTSRDNKLGSSVSGSGEGLHVGRDDMGTLKEELEKAMRNMPDFQLLRNQVIMTVTGEGLRVELLETDMGMFFESGNAVPSRNGQQLLVMLARELGKLPNQLLIEGHTDARPFLGAGTYSNWELSTDRANAARQLMEESGLARGQVVQVRGFADRRLRDPDDPNHASNRRISVIVRYLNPALEESN